MTPTDEYKLRQLEKDFEKLLRIAHDLALLQEGTEEHDDALIELGIVAKQHDLYSQ